MEGHTFSGWTGEPETMPAHDVDVEGWFIVNQYTVTYYIDGVQYGDVETYDYGEAITLRENPEPREGYTFGGWEDPFPETMPAYDVEENGYFTINKHTFSFYVDSAAWTAITADYGTTGLTTTVGTPDTEVGFHFTGWFDNTGNTLEVPDTMPDYDLDFYGYIEKNVWTASFYVTDENGDRSKVGEADFEYGETIVYPDVEVPEGYKLNWTEEHATMPDSDIDIEGQIEEIPKPTTIYYGFVKTSDISNVSENGLSSFEYEDGVETNTDFVLAGDERYLEIETEEDIDNWMLNERVDYVILSPENTSVSLLDAGKVAIIGGGNGNSLNIEGNVYNVFVFDANGLTPTESTMTISTYITIEEN